MNYLAMLSGIIVGIIIFQTGFITRTVFNHLDEANTKIFLRAIFPKFFLLLTFLGFAYLLISSYYHPGINKNFVLGCINTALPTICYMLTPVINKAKDNDEKSIFRGLHFITVLFTVIVLIFNAIILFL
ncbi:MAG: hypothetical protein ACI8XI_000225 [Woeseiaceae bacterium]|jgi:hypothetical protein|tara:strand:+ start:21482 stop:21868 length:387 start_codon:yes stop_codon:yes gene_type:complete